MLDNAGGCSRWLLLALVILSVTMSIMAFLQSDIVFVWLGGLLLGAGFGLWAMDG